MDNRTGSIPMCPEIVRIKECTVNPKMNAQGFEFTRSVVYAKNVRPRVFKTFAGRLTGQVGRKAAAGRRSAKIRSSPIGSKVFDHA